MYSFKDVETFILGKFSNALKIEPLAKGGHAHAYSYLIDDREYVIRFSPYNEDFAKDKFANRFDSENLPTPKVFEIGEAFGGYYCITEKFDGLMLDELTHNQIKSAIPSILKTLDALREADISGTSGYGPFDINGEARNRTWAEHLLEGLEDNPHRRNAGWYRKLQESKYGTEIYDQGKDTFKECIKSAPNIRHLIHYDLLNRNVMVEDNKICAVFDWGCGRYGDFLFELAAFTFWAPVLGPFADFDWRSLAKDHYDEINLNVEDFDQRLKTYELFIGLDHLQYHSHIERWDRYEQTEAMVVDVLQDLARMAQFREF